MKQSGRNITKKTEPTFSHYRRLKKDAKRGSSKLARTRLNRQVKTEVGRCPD